MKALNVAIPTPFHEDETINFPVFIDIIKHLKQNGIESFLVSGSTGEQHSLSIDERLKIIDYFQSHQAEFHDVELIFGVAATRTKDAIRLVQALENTIFDAIMLGFPPYIRPTQEQAIHYVDTLMQYSTKEVALYNNPGRTGFDLAADSVQTLIQKHPNILGLKESGDIHRHQINSFPEGFIMFHAADMNFATNFPHGFNGLSSIVANVYPQEIKQAVDELLNSGQVDHDSINQLINEVNQKQAVIFVKNHFNQLSIHAGICRAPITNI